MNATFTHFLTNILRNEITKTTPATEQNQELYPPPHKPAKLPNNKHQNRNNRTLAPTRTKHRPPRTHTHPNQCATPTNTQEQLRNSSLRSLLSVPLRSRPPDQSCQQVCVSSHSIHNAQRDTHMMVPNYTTLLSALCVCACFVLSRLVIQE